MLRSKVHQRCEEALASLNHGELPATDPELLEGGLLFWWFPHFSGNAPSEQDFKTDPQEFC
jgi:hypothetical protein